MWSVRRSHFRAIFAAESSAGLTGNGDHTGLTFRARLSRVLVLSQLPSACTRKLRTLNNLIITNFCVFPIRRWPAHRSDTPRAPSFSRVLPLQAFRGWGGDGCCFLGLNQIKRRNQGGGNTGAALLRPRVLSKNRWLKVKQIRKDGNQGKRIECEGEKDEENER